MKCNIKIKHYLNVITRCHNAHSWSIAFCLMVHGNYLHLAESIQIVRLGWMRMNGCGWHECVWSHLLQVFQDDVSGNIEIVVSLYFRSFLKVVLHYILWFLNIWCRAELNGDAASWLQSVIVPCDTLCWFYPLASLLTLVFKKKEVFLHVRNGLAAGLFRKGSQKAPPASKHCLHALDWWQSAPFLCPLVR